MVNFLQRSCSEIDSGKRNLDLVGKMMDMEHLGKSPEKPLGDSEKKEKGFDALKEGEKRKLAFEEKEMILKRQKFIRREEALDEVGDVRRPASKKMKDIESGEESLRAARESLAERERKVDLVIDSLGERISAVEKREKEFDCFREGKEREMMLEEEQLHAKWEEFVRLVKLLNEKFRKQEEKFKNGVFEKLELAENKLEAMRAKLDERLKEIEFRENAAAQSVKEADLIRESMEKQLEEFEKMKSEFNSFQEDKMRKLDSKELQLNVMSEELAKKAKLWNEQLITKERRVHRLLKRLKSAEDNVEGLKNVVDERFKEIGLKEIDINSTIDWVERKMEEADSKIKELEWKEKRIKTNEQIVILKKTKLELKEKTSWALQNDLEVKQKEVEAMRVKIDERLKEIEFREKQLEEFEKMKSEFNSFQEHKARELGSKELQLNAMSEELAKKAKLWNKQLITKQRQVHGLLKRLKLAEDNVEGLKTVVEERFKEIGLKEIDVNSTMDWVEMKVEEADSKIKELEGKEEIIKTNEQAVICKTNKLELKEKTLWAWQKDLEVQQKKVDSAQQLNEQQLENLDERERSLKEFVSSCFKEHLARKRRLQVQKDLVEKVAGFLGLKEENLEHALRELEFGEKQTGDHVEELELEQQQSTDNVNAHVKIKPDESVDLQFTVRMDGKSLQMFLNDPEKDLESMGDEIFEVLHLSSDPAKLVLDAMAGFYPPHLRKGDVAFNVRRTCIALLRQLIKMSGKIKPHVREEAVELATAWKSKMRAATDNPNTLEVLGFLLLLAAYNLASCFDKDEVSSLLMMVAQHKETPELYPILGFAESRTEHVPAPRRSPARIEGGSSDRVLATPIFRGNTEKTHPAPTRRYGKGLYLSGCNLADGVESHCDVDDPGLVSRRCQVLLSQHELDHVRDQSDRVLIETTLTQNVQSINTIQMLAGRLKECRDTEDHYKKELEKMNVTLQGVVEELEKLNENKETREAKWKEKFEFECQAVARFLATEKCQTYKAKLENGAVSTDKESTDFQKALLERATSFYAEIMRSCRETLRTFG